MNDLSQPCPDGGADISGRQLGDYRLLRRLGRGAMAEVYLAEQTSLNRQVAIKVLKRDLATDQTYVKRFQREAQAAASLVHANIVQIHEVGCIDGVYFIAQEYVQGLNLRQWLTRNGPVDLRLALIIMRQAASALAKAADQGIIHRDIKPENIMLARSGEVKVADFGLARLTGVGAGVDLTQIGMTMGTPLYMSPEQVEGDSLDPRSDIYSLGVTCYHMLAGVPPFEGETALSLAVQHLKKQPEPLENLRPDLPPALARIVHRMLAKDPRNRFQSPRELLKELRQVQLAHADDDWPEDLPGWETDGVDLVATRNETTRRLDSLMKTAAMAQLKRPRWSLWAAGCLAAFVGGAVVAYATTRQPSLLAGARSQRHEVKHFDNVLAQFIYASQVGTEEAWLSVINDFKDKTSYVNLAKQQLARVYLWEEDYSHAVQYFRELADLGEVETDLRAFGLIGQYWVLVKRGDYEQATGVLNDLYSLPPEKLRAYLLRDSLMSGLLNTALNLQRSKSGAPPTVRQWDEWQDWLKKQMTPAPAAEPESPKAG